MHGGFWESHSFVFGSSSTLRPRCQGLTNSEKKAALMEAYELLQRALPTMMATQQFVGSEGAAAKHLAKFSHMSESRSSLTASVRGILH